MTRKKLAAYAIPIASCLLFAGCLFNNDPYAPSPVPPRPLTGAEQGLVDAGNAFGFELFREINKEDPGKSVFISSLSVSLSLGMAMNGAMGETLDSMLATLRFPGLTLAQADSSYRSLIRLITTLDPAVASNVANSIWYRQGLPVAGSFIDRGRTYFNAEVAALDFAAPGAPDIINAWVSRSTNGTIPAIIDSIDPFTVMYLINAIYFKGAWTTQFDPRRTRSAPFYLADGSTTTCSMMALTDDFQFAATEDFLAVDLPYGNGYFSMTIMLPRPGMSIDSLVARFTQEHWKGWLAAMSETEVAVMLPRFKLEYELELTRVLTALGMGIAFEPGRADFSGMIDPSSGFPDALYISEVKHKTFVEVNEEGTEASAATSTGMSGTAAPPSITVDRPFLFFIREHHSGAILFAGKCLSP